MCNTIRYTFIKKVNGDLVISKYLTNFIEMCIDLSSYNGVDGSRNQLVDKKAAIVVSRSLGAILDSLI